MVYLRFSASLVKQIVILGALLAFTQNLFCQNELKDATGTWLVLSGNHQIGEKWKIPTVGIIRYYNLSESTEFGFFRTGLTYTSSNRYSFTVGAAYLDTQPFDHTEIETLTTQHWTYEELCFNSTLYHTKISQRFRLEQRWISKPNETMFNHRLRYRLQFKKDISKHVYLKVFDEPFFDFKEANISQNRFFVGVGRRISSNIDIEIGYMKNHVGQNNYDRIRMVFLFKTTLYKKAKDNFASTD